MSPRAGLRQSRFRVSVEEIHKYLWTLVDEYSRVCLPIADVAAHFGTGYATMNHTMLRMREQNRIKRVGCNARKQFIYEITNPDTYDRHLPETQVVKARRPAWG